MAAQAVRNSYLVRNNAKLNRETKRLQSLLLSWQTEVARLKAENKALIATTAKSGALSLELDILRRNTNTHKDSEFDSVVADNAHLSQKAKSLADLMITLHTERDVLAASLTARQKEIIDQNNAITELKTKNDKLTKELGDAYRSAEKMSETNKRLVVESEVHSAEINAVKHENTRLKHTNQTLSAQRKETVNKVDELTRTERDASRLTELLKKETAAKNDELLARRHQITECQQTIETLRKQLTTLTAVKTKHETDIQNLIVTFARLSTHAAHRTRAFVWCAVQIDKSELSSQIDKVGAVRDHLEKQRDTLKTEVEGWSEKYRDTKQRLEEEIDLSNTKCRETENRLADTSKELTSVTESRSDVQTQLNAAKYDAHCRCPIRLNSCDAVCAEPRSRTGK